MLTGFIILVFERVADLGPEESIAGEFRTSLRFTLLICGLENMSVFSRIRDISRCGPFWRYGTTIIFFTISGWTTFGGVVNLRACAVRRWI